MFLLLDHALLFKQCLTWQHNLQNSPLVFQIHYQQGYYGFNSYVLKTLRLPLRVASILA